MHFMKATIQNSSIPLIAILVFSSGPRIASINGQTSAALPDDPASQRKFSVEGQSRKVAEVLRDRASLLAKAFSERDIEEVIRLHDRDAVVIYGGKAHLSLDEVRKTWEAYFDRPGNPVHPVTLDGIDVRGGGASTWGRYWHQLNGQDVGGGYWLALWALKSGEWKVYRFMATATHTIPPHK
jgi:hypothetical protein